MLLLEKNTQQIFTPTSVTCQAASAFWPWMLGFQVGLSSELGGKAFRQRMKGQNSSIPNYFLTENRETVG